MKKQLSVFALHARAAIGRLALVLLGMLALDTAAYVLFGLRGFRASLTGSELVTALRVIFSLGLVACQLLLAACFGAGSRYGYTLRRLRVSQRELFLWQAAHNAVCYFLLLAVQTLIVLALCRVYAAQDPDMVNSQTVFLAFYRVPFLHSLLPLADGWRYVRNAVLCAALGVCAAAFPVQQRQGNRGFAAVILTALTVLFFVQPVRSGDFWLIGALVVITAVALLNVTEVSHETA